MIGTNRSCMSLFITYSSTTHRTRSGISKYAESKIRGTLGNRCLMWQAIASESSCLYSKRTAATSDSPTASLRYACSRRARRCNHEIPESSCEAPRLAEDRCTTEWANPSPDSPLQSRDWKVTKVVVVLAVTAHLQRLDSPATVAIFWETTLSVFVKLSATCRKRPTRFAQRRYACPS